MNEATISGVFESLDDENISDAARRNGGGSLYGKVHKSPEGSASMDFILIDLDEDEIPKAAEGWAYIGIYYDPNIWDR